MLNLPYPINTIVLDLIPFDDFKNFTKMYIRHIFWNNHNAKLDQIKKSTFR